MPGVSKSSTLLLSLIHCFPLVTPGLLPVLVHAFPAKLLINVDFPTFGMPATMALTGLLIIPRCLSRSIFSAQAFFITLLTALTPFPFLELTFVTKYPLSS